MSYATIDALRQGLGGTPKASDDPVYAAKYLHKLPEPKLVPNRNAFILKHVTGKRVLEFGASGPLHEAIKKVASFYIGVDREGEDRPGWWELRDKDVPNGTVYGYDLDDIGVYSGDLPTLVFKPFDFGTHPDIIVCGEVLEHLSNPGFFLSRLRETHKGTPLIITVPNAFAAASQAWIAKGFENVNDDHVAWYSPKTLSVLLTRAGYETGDLYYYHGTGPTAEGLIVVTE